MTRRERPPGFNSFASRLSGNEVCPFNHFGWLMRPRFGTLGPHLKAWTTASVPFFGMPSLVPVRVRFPLPRMINRQTLVD